MTKIKSRWPKASILIAAYDKAESKKRIEKRLEKEARKKAKRQKLLERDE